MPIDEPGLLETLSDVVSAPRRAVWSAIGLPESGTDLIANTFGMDPESAWTKVLGTGAEIVGDPLVWAMSPALWSLAGKGLGALRAAKASKLADLASAKQGLLKAEASAEDLFRYQPAMRRMGEAARSAPTSYYDELLTRFAPEASGINRYRGVEMLDPSQTSQMEQLVSSGGRMPKGMHGAIIRHPTAGPIGFTGEAENIAPGAGTTLGRAMRNILRPSEKAARSVSGLQGAYDPATNTLIQMAGADPATMPHELFHALTRNASLTGDWANLPFLQRSAAKLYRPGELARSAAQVGEYVPEAHTFRQGLASILDELGSWSMENPDLSGRIRGGLRYLVPTPSQLVRSAFTPDTAWRSYISQAGRVNPWAGALYGATGLAPYAIGAGGAGAAIGQLLGEE